MSARDVGQFVAEKFDERRKKLATAIGAQLERFRSLGQQQTMDVDVGRLLAPTEPPPPVAFTGTLPMIPAPSAPPPAAAKRMSGATAMMLVAAALGLGLLATGVVVATRVRPKPAEAATTPPAAPASVPPKKADEPEIDFTVKASPANAVISVDGQVMTTNPVVGRQRRDGAIHVIRVEAPGYEAREESVTFDRSFLVTVELKAAGPAPSGKPGGRRWKAAPRGGAGKPGAPSGSLDSENPYQ